VVNCTLEVLYPWDRAPSVRKVEGCVDPRPGLDVLEKIKISCPGLELDPRLSRLWPSHYSDCTIPACVQVV